MSDQTHIWIGGYALLALLLGLVVLIGRRFRATPNDSPRLRYTRLRAVCISYGILCVLQGVADFHGHETVLWKKYLALVLMGLCFGMFWLQSWQARKKWQISTGFKSPPPKKPALFFWQAVFILLPVAGLAGFGLYSLRQDRLLAEQEARESGEVLAQRTAQAVGSEGVRQLREYCNASMELHAYRSTDLGIMGWAGGKPAQNEGWQRIQTWQRANPEIDLATLPPADARTYFEAQPEAMPPEPPKWLGQLTSEQQQLWQAAKASEFTTQDAAATQAAIEKFIASKPSKGARANAEFLLLLAQARGLAPSNAVTLFAEFSRSHWGNSDEPSDAGLPLGQLICHQALRRLPDGAGLPENFVRNHTVAWMIEYRPSIFSPVLIAETERVARGTAQEPFAATLRAWWQADAAARQVLEDFREEYPTNTWKTAPFWVDSRAGKFLLVLGDPRNPPTNSAAPHILYDDYLLIPQVMIEQSLAKAMHQSEIFPPPYALVEFEIAGRSCRLSSGPMAANKSARLPVLAQAGGVLADLPRPQHAYPFRIRVSLASPEILYARQRQRTWMFGALIVASLVAAVMGLFAAWRSFRRQQELNEQKSNFVSSVSHELRAPIAAVRLMAENLERGKISEPARQGEYFRFIVQECRRLSSLIENVLDFSRIEQGRKQYDFEPTNLVALAETTVKLMEPYAAEKSVKLKLETSHIPHPTSHIELDVDGRAIQQALVNLIDNAVKHSPKGETVTVGIQSRTGGAPASGFSEGKNRETAATAVLLYVTDHGPGIPAAEQEKIFERFYRLGSELRRETQGVGIGLSLVKHIAEAHGGRVRVQSEPGQGSTFTIELWNAF